MSLHLSDSSLSPAEKEEQEAERLIEHKPPHSRKYVDRRGPKWDARRQRIQESDPDLQENSAEKDKDNSLNYKAVGTIAAGGKPTEDSISALKKTVKQIRSDLAKASPSLAKDFDQFSGGYLGPEMAGISAGDMKGYFDYFNNVENFIGKREKEFKQSVKGMNPNEVQKFIVDNWPKDSEDDPDWGTRAGLINAVHFLIDAYPIPMAVKAPLERLDISDITQDRKLVKRIIESSARDNYRLVKDEDITNFAQLAAIYRAVAKNPKALNLGSLQKDVKKLSGDLENQSEKMLELGSILRSWHDMLSGFKTPGRGEAWHWGDSINQVTNSIQKFLQTSGKEAGMADPGKFMQGIGDYIKDKYGSIPAELQALIGKSSKAASDSATSNEIDSIKAMANRLAGIQHSSSNPLDGMAARIATYHGVKNTSGNPTDPPIQDLSVTSDQWEIGSVPCSYDKRNFNEDHWKAILKHAEELLQEDWFKYGWDGSVVEAPLRAALDISIYTNKLFQGKIDAETYEMLINRLAGWGHDSFSETILPMKAVKTASSGLIHSTLQRASEVLEHDPRTAMTMVNNVRALVSAEGDLEQSMETQKPQHGLESTPSAETPVEQTGAQGILSPKLGEKPIPPEVKEELKQSFKELMVDVITDEWIDGFTTWRDMMAELKGKTGKTAADDDVSEVEIADLADMSDEEVAQFMSTFHKNVQDAEHALDANDIDTLFKAWDDAVKAVQTKRTGSVRVNASTLIQLAWEIPEARKTLLPVLAAIAKKKGKKGPKKGKKPGKKDKKGPEKSKKEPEKKTDKKPAGPPTGKSPVGKPPWADKRAPGKGTELFPKKSRKSSVQIDADDLNW